MHVAQAQQSFAAKARGGSVRKAVAGVLDKRKGLAWPASVADCVVQVRTMCPRCDLTDADLADVIAIYAVEHGINLAFDFRARSLPVL